MAQAFVKVWIFGRVKFLLNNRLTNSITDPVQLHTITDDYLNKHLIVYLLFDAQLPTF